ncbi:nicotinate phosphoribosyltransferase [Candidatus Poribacteria bacterium]|nr:nicotinate phosphoribosyltransferase [Candidatus Poribacteria bacterium]
MRQYPQSALLTIESLALFADYYELTMGQADFDRGNNSICTENYFIRKIPQGNYLVVAGLEQVIHYILNLKFTDADLAWLQSGLPGSELNDNFIDYLRNFKFDGDVYAMPEGSLAFANEPLINITGRSIDIQLFETYLLSVMNFQTLIATKAARVVQSANGRTCFDFGARRAHGRDAAILAARASFIGGVKGTSLVVAGKYFDIPYMGTMAHKFIQDSPSELQAFRDYAKTFPHNTILLIDTYDTLRGTRYAVQVAQEMAARGHQMRGVRIDSGDLLSISQAVRQILDQADLQAVQIFASNDLDEFQIDRLLKAGAPIDGFGVGTRLATGAVLNSVTGEGGASAMPGVYKHVEREEDGEIVPTLKLSDEPGKSTLPCKKQVQRLREDHQYAKDRICLWDEVSEEEGLMIPVVRDGELVYNFPPLQQIQGYAHKELQQLPDRYKGLSQGNERENNTYPIEISPQLSSLQAQLIADRAKFQL